MESKPINLIVQGDVFIHPSKIPPQAKKLDHHILAEGEVTGHAHKIGLEFLKYASLFEHNKTLFLKVEGLSGIGGISIVHEEHKPVIVPEGEWKVGIVREYDPFEQEARQVRD